MCVRVSKPLHKPLCISMYHYDTQYNQVHELGYCRGVYIVSACQVDVAIESN